MRNHAQVTTWESTRDSTANSYYGAFGRNTVQDAAVSGGSSRFFVNSTSIRYDDANWAEVGWRWAGGESRARLFAAWSVHGDWDYQTFDTFVTGTNHSFETRRNSSGTLWWNWYADGSSFLAKELALGHGTVVAQQERYNACDTVDESHWWYLQRAYAIGSFSNWENQVKGYMNDPDYCVRIISNTEFETPRESSSYC